jgi:DNA-binding transcriptional LysR family regulator
MNDWAEFRHFKYLLAILELEGFRAASEQLHTAQPNLSMHAKQFQEYASVRLYDQAKDRSIKPTDTGIAFKFIAKSLLEARDEAMEALAAIDRGDIDFVRFGSSPFVDQTLFQRFCRMHKDLLPSCTVRPEISSTVQLVDDILEGVIDAAIVTLPLKHPALKIEEIRKDRLVVCLRADHPCASKKALSPSDLQRNLTILHHPQQHPEAHDRLLELLGEAGIEISDYSRASHPMEMQTLVKEGYGFALIREGATLQDELTTRPIIGVQWTVDTALIYGVHHHPPTIPVLARKFKRDMRNELKLHTAVPQKRDPVSAKADPLQLKLLG